MQEFDEPNKMYATRSDGSSAGKVTLLTHRKKDCTPPCAIHSPSWHPLKDAPMVFRSDKMGMIERQCEHGIGHSDPDSLRFLISQGVSPSIGVHGCDGCCSR